MEVNKSQGCLLGLAIGDALGAPVEFRKAGSFEPVTGYRAGGEFNLRAGQYTDDASMALCLAESLRVCRDMNLLDQCQRYWNWYAYGENSSTGECFDIGDGTKEALETWWQTGKLFPSPTGLGNGCIMRLAPIPIFYSDTIDAARYSQLSATTTHGHPDALKATGFFGGLLSLALNGCSKEELMRDVPQDYRKIEIIPSGHVVESLNAAIWAFETTDSFEDAVLKAVNLGGDADTIGAITGQLAGAFYGLSGIPHHLVLGLQDYEHFLDVARRLTALCPLVKSGYI